MFTAESLIKTAKTIIELSKYNKRRVLSTDETVALGSALIAMKEFLDGQTSGMHARLFDRRNPLGEIKRLKLAIDFIYTHETADERYWRCLYYFSKRCRNYFSAIQAEARGYQVTLSQNQR